jgi:hypothetical protein
MHPILRNALSLTATTAILVASATQALAGDCTPMLERIAPYERGVGEAIDDEAEDLPKELSRYSRAMQSGHSDQAERINRKIRSGLVALEALDAPVEVAKLHAGLIDYYRAGVAVLDARAHGDEAAHHAAEIETWLGLRSYFKNLRDLFVEHDCMPGEVEAINDDYLPMLDEQIAKLRSGESPPAHY